MKLVSVTVQNFRCYQAPFKIKIDSFTAIIGKNDVGKSALLEAMSIFFEQSKMDQSDASVDGDAQDVKITCEFSDLPETLIVDAEHPTTLAGEHLLNEVGNLEIVTSWNQRSSFNALPLLPAYPSRFMICAEHTLPSLKASTFRIMR